MKKLLFVFVTIISVQLLSACQSQGTTVRFDENGNSENVEVTDTPTPEETDATETEDANEEAPEAQAETPSETQDVAEVAIIEEATQEELPEEVVEEPEVTEENSEENPQVEEVQAEEVEAEPETIPEPEPEVEDNTPAIKEIIEGQNHELQVSSMENNSLESSLSYQVVRGKTSSSTYQIEINGYKLRKYVAGSTNWNYIASTQTKTLKEGNNNYVVRALDKEGNELDKINFTINYTPKTSHSLPDVGTSLWLSLLTSLLITSLYWKIRHSRI